MCAAAFARRLDRDRYDITLIESADIGTVGVGEATLPHIKTFNDMLGIDEARFMRNCKATFKLGIEFVDWGRKGNRYIHPFGTFGEAWRGLGFHHYWTRARRLNQHPAPLNEYSYAVMAAQQGRFEFPNEDQKSIRSTYAYAYHFDAGLYGEFLREWATARGVKRIEGRIDHVTQTATGDIATLTLASGAIISGDLFVDCSGFRALLLDGALNSPWENWTHWLPCDRALAMPVTRSGDLASATRSTAQAAGWTWRIPLQHRTGTGYVFSSSHITETEAHDTLNTNAQGLADPRLLRFRAGRRPKAWTGNCVGIGLASGFLEPLESTSIYLIQVGALSLAELIPTTPGPTDPRLAAEFNRRSDIEYERIRDFLILHYHANGRTGEAFWDDVRHMAIPDSLAHKIELFRRRGHIPAYKDGLFSPDSWLSVLAGQDILPGNYDRLADALDPDQTARLMADLRERIAGQVAAMPAHGDFVSYFAEAREEMPA
ncbi:hypothetical protein ABAC460_18995 [Asticcacaulis sp. AC460]|nr:hypothetical protein ABAC460_18995 [Asticcacaulis sp. AC460]